MKTGMKKTLLITMLLIAGLLVLTGCGDIPEDDDFPVSRLIEFRLNGFEKSEYAFTTPGILLDNDSLEGNIVSIQYADERENAPENRTARIVAAKTDSVLTSYRVWRHYARENDAGMKSLLTSFPLYGGSYEISEKGRFLESWFKSDWVFLLESGDETVLEQMKTQIERFFKREKYVNESVIEI